MIENLVDDPSEQSPRRLVKQVKEPDHQNLRLERSEQALLNIMEDLKGQNLRLERSQQALLNVMEDLKESETRERQARDALEARVRQRTVELFTANQRLEIEIDERDRQAEARKAVEAALREQEQRLRLITDSIPAFITYVGADRRFEFVNQQALMTFGRASRDAIGHHMQEVLGTVYAELEPRVGSGATR